MGRVLAAAALVSIPAACADDASQGGAAGVAGSSGSSAVAGAAGAAGTGGSGGEAGDGGMGGHGGDICFQGTFDITAEISGTGFGYADGTEVRATFGGSSQGALNESTSLDGGAFQLSFESITGACNLGASRLEPIAVLIDVDGDGVCRLATDELFLNWAAGGPGGGSNAIALSPAADHCSVGADYAASSTLDAARRLCPEIGDCVPSCEPPAPSPNPVPDLSCRLPGDAGLDAGSSDGADASVSDATDADGGP